MRKFIETQFGEMNVESGRFDWCRSPKTGYCFPFDVVLASHNILVECDGRQHLQAVPHFNRDLSFEEIYARDRFKEERAVENGFSVIRVRQVEIRGDKNEWKQRLLDAIESIDVLKPCVIKLY